MKLKFHNQKTLNILSFTGYNNGNATLNDNPTSPTVLPRIIATHIKMGLRKIFSFSHSVFDISKMYLVLFLMWTNALQMQLWTNAQPVSSNQCKNKLVVKSGMYDLNKDVYDLKEVWKSCAINNSGQYGRDPNSEVWKLCRSASHNLQMLCNMTIPENKISDAKNIWQEKTNHANICQGMLSEH